MVVDTSAIAAILFDEADALSFRLKIEASDICLISGCSLLEMVIVLSTRSPDMGVAPLYDLLRALQVVTSPVTLSQSEIAIQTFLRYVKGRHPARLNFGDCFSYALAKSMDMPLLFKGADFSKTDIRIA